MNDKPIDIKKYPLVGQAYNLVSAIDALPPSSEATGLVIDAGELMVKVWNYMEAHQPKSRLSGLMEDALKAKYGGKKIRDKYNGTTFTVEDIEVTPDGPDPQMTVILCSKRYREAVKVWKEWQLKNNPLGTIPTSSTPEEIRKPYEEACKECVWMSQVDDVLPEIVP